MLINVTSQAAVNAERAELSRASRDVLELRRQVESLNDKLLVSRVENRGERVSVLSIEVLVSGVGKRKMGISFSRSFVGVCLRLLEMS